MLHQLIPGYHTIVDFRKDNAAAIKNAFKVFEAFLKGEDLLGGETLGVDGIKLQARNNKKNNFNEAKFAKTLAYIETKTAEYLQDLDTCDAQEDKQAIELKKRDGAKKLEELKERKEYYGSFQKVMFKSGEKQISMSDPESRSLPLKYGITDVCYNVQAVADRKSKTITPARRQQYLLPMIKNTKK